MINHNRLKLLAMVFGLAFLILLTEQERIPSVLSQNQERDALQIVMSLSWSPNGEKLLVTGRGQPDVWGVWLYDAYLAPLQFFSTESSAYAGWNHDGSHFFIGSTVFDSGTLDKVLSFEGTILGWSADGSEIFITNENAYPDIYDAKTGQFIRSTRVEGIMPDGLVWSPDGQYTLFIQPTGQLEIRRALDDVLVTSLDAQFANGLSWSKDSRYIAGSTLELVAPGTPNVLPYAPSPTLASVKIWDVKTGKIVQSFSGLITLPLLLRWHPYKSELAGAAPDGVIYVWNVDTGEQLHAFTTLEGLRGFAYSPSGGRLVIGANSQRQSVIDKSFYPKENYAVKSVVKDALQAIVLDPSSEKINEIEAACVPAQAQSTLPAAETLLSETTSAVDVAPLTAYIEAVQADMTIPPGCAADLIAVAQALQAETTQP